jgi:hypothetical protein
MGALSPSGSTSNRPEPDNNWGTHNWYNGALLSILILMSYASGPTRSWNLLQESNDGLTSGTDNEYTQSPASHAEYFEQLKHFYISNGVVVPL